MHVKSHLTKTHAKLHSITLSIWRADKRAQNRAALYIYGTKAYRNIDICLLPWVGPRTVLNTVTHTVMLDTKQAFTLVDFTKKGTGFLNTLTQSPKDRVREATQVPLRQSPHVPLRITPPQSDRDSKN